MKKIISHIISFTTAVSLLLVSSAQAVAAGRPQGDVYDLEGRDLSTAKHKPTISISQERITKEEAKENPIRTVNVYISGADSAYSTAGFTIKFDERLTLIKDKRGKLAKAGEALEYCSPSFVSDTDHGIRTIISASSNVGLDGKLFSFNVELPDNISDEGEKFPIEVYYNKEHDLFTNISVDEDGKMMQAWLFTNGIEQGFIEVAPKNAKEPDPGIGDTNGDGRVDSIDASRILAVFATFSTSGGNTEISLAIFDINGDSKVDSVDASIVLAYYVFNSMNNFSLNFIDFLKGYKIW